MERFYIVDDDSDLARSFRNYAEYKRQVINAFKEFKKKHSIETDRFFVNADMLYIVPTEKDIDRFEHEFYSKTHGRFKKNSIYNKLWVQFCKERNIVYPGHVFVQTYFNYLNKRCSYNMFEYQGKVYLKFSAFQSFTAPDYCKPISENQYITAYDYAMWTK